jgi:hypothetical protein
MKREELEKVKDAIISALHREVGVCGHCGKSACPDRRKWSILPKMLPVGTVLDAINNVKIDETGS